MNKYIELDIINRREPTVIIGWETFKRLLKALPKSLLIKEFAEDHVTEIEWKKCSKEEIINIIFIENEN